MRDTSIERYEHAGFEISIYNDVDLQNPREEFDNLGKLWIPGGGRKYIAVNEIGWHEEYWDNRRRNQTITNVLRRLYPRCVLLPVYRFEHSIVIYQTTPFTGPYASWDSGQVGFILATAEDIRERYQVKRITQNLRERVERQLSYEIEMYSQWASGDGYGWVIDELNEEDGDNLSSCWGYYTIDHCKLDAEEEAQYLRNHRNEHVAA